MQKGFPSAVGQAGNQKKTGVLYFKDNASSISLRTHARTTLFSTFVPAGFYTYGRSHFFQKVFSLLNLHFSKTCHKDLDASLNFQGRTVL